MTWAQNGVPVNGFPKWEERVLHEWTNRARCDPQAEMTTCGTACSEAACYTAKPPLAWSLGLNRAARFHCDEMRAQSFFAHDSRCTLVSNISSLYPDSCTGAASCACVGGSSVCSPSCTSTFSRIGLFGVSGSGEVIASASNPNQAFYLWLYEDNFGSTACNFGLPNGHRFLILTSAGSIGAGSSGSYFTMNFGPGGTPSKIPSGAHFPRQAASVDFWANWYDTAGPSQALVVVDGVSSPMTLGRGTQQNGAWSATISGVGTGCHRYYFDFRDSTGGSVTYPNSGSFGIGVTGCADWDASRPASSGAVPDGRTVPGVPLSVSKAAGSQLSLAWGASCNLADTDYEVYEGALGNFTSHIPLLCSTFMATSATVTPTSGDRFYLVVPTTGSVEGSYGTNSAGAQRAASGAFCHPQGVSPCP